jgi:hypothetical protein
MWRDQIEQWEFYRRGQRWQNCGAYAEMLLRTLVRQQRDRASN